MNKNKIAYKELKAKQKQDLGSGIAGYYIYRHFSTPFTWTFVKFRIPPNIITIFSFFLCIIGFYFLSIGTYISLIFGLLFFILFKILDMSDGEVARIQNKTSIEGIYFDRISHYLYTCCLGIGLGLGFYRSYKSDIYIVLGFLFMLVFILENAINDMLKSVLREGIINKNLNKKKFNKTQMLEKYVLHKLMERLNKGREWLKSNILSKLVSIYPFQGLIYSDTFTTPILIVLVIFEYLLSIFVGFPFKYNIIGIVPFYILIVTISKTIWIVWLIYRIEKYRYITTTLNKV